MRQQTLRIAIIGAGIGGLTAAACLRRIGVEVCIFEQARGFTRLGAGIQQAPNAIRVLYALGLKDRLLAQAFQPDSNDSRDYDTGALTNSLPLGEAVRARHGVPYFLMHRGDLHAMLAELVPPEAIRLNHRLMGLDHNPDGTVRLRFTNGESAEADAVIGADGVHSIVREAMLGPEAPRFTGRVAYRTVFPTRRLNGLDVYPCIKWWGPDRHIVSYFVNPRRDELYFVTSTPEPDFSIESWSSKGDLDTLRAAYDMFHPQVRAILAACPDVHKWALVERDPLPRWVEGNVALLGDACHPMTPYMAQGASTSIEDGAVLSRCLDGVDRDGVNAALRRYEATRKPRTSRIQLTSAQNTWLRQPHDADWVYGYDAWTEPLAPAS
ncbi:FAD-dependent monooxygenase [Rhodopila sp.]|jgi:salicylate hydroxylase/6-hydroxynicotinate 3-monooxygenase|uniref:FAD-dependent monooxygenase n=1 Tax=Rhodopila sp. TaxID=2480087 RepID=UPI002CFF5D02|nr:FAD-dependent monooxygenase [Rhodopila sp.]HVZ07687.1 FAD-dependent monooxygenase [Rhodopila sp.]